MLFYEIWQHYNSLTANVLLQKITEHTIWSKYHIRTFTDPLAVNYFKEAPQIMYIFIASMHCSLSLWPQHFQKIQLN